MALPASVLEKPFTTAMASRAVSTASWSDPTANLIPPSVLLLRVLTNFTGGDSDEVEDEHEEALFGVEAAATGIVVGVSTVRPVGVAANQRGLADYKMLQLKSRGGVLREVLNCLSVSVVIVSGWGPLEAVQQGHSDLLRTSDGHSGVLQVSLGPARRGQRDSRRSSPGTRHAVVGELVPGGGRGGSHSRGELVHGGHRRDDLVVVGAQSPPLQPQDLVG